MNLQWFKRNGLFYIPTTFIGWLLLFVGIAYAVYTFIAIDSRSHSVSDTLINFVFNLIIIVAVYSFIAFFTSRNVK